MVRPSSPKDSIPEVTNKGFPSIKAYSINVKTSILGDMKDTVFWRLTFINSKGVRKEFEFIPRKDEVVIIKSIDRDKISKTITKDFIYDHLIRLMKEGLIDA